MSSGNDTTSTLPNPQPSIWERARSFIYDKAVVNMTVIWYKQVLHKIPPNSHILDIGIGTGTALLANASLLRSKEISVVGVDFDPAYVATCKKLINEANLQNQVAVHHADIYDFKPTNRLFNHIYFSGSFMILPRPAEALKKAVNLLLDREDGRIYFTQTFELKKNRFLEWVKPQLGKITSIEFGNVTYEDDFEEQLHVGGVVVEHSELIDDGHINEGVREARLIVARSHLYVEEKPATIS